MGTARNQLREVLSNSFVNRSGRLIRDSPTTSDALAELILNPEVINKLDETNLHFIDGYYSSCVLLADHVLMLHEEISSNIDNDDFVTRQKVISWKEECTNVRIHYL